MCKPASFDKLRMLDGLAQVACDCQRKIGAAPLSEMACRICFAVK